MTTAGDRAPHPNSRAERGPSVGSAFLGEELDARVEMASSREDIDYAVGRFRAVAGDRSWPYPHALDLGCGTGFFLLNLMRGGVIERGSVTDVSPELIDVALRNARTLGLDVDGRVSEPARISYEDNSFDLVVGHAVLRAIPDVPGAMHEVLRVLKPGGRFVFAGDPTKVGDFCGQRLDRLTWWLTANVTRLPSLSAWRPQAPAAGTTREATLHTFEPGELERVALAAGAVDVRAVTEELSAALFGRPVRTFESLVPQEKLGSGWTTFVHGTRSRLSWVDRALLSQVVPRGVFHHLLLTGTKPDAPQRL